MLHRAEDCLKKPVCSVIMPACNSERYIAEAIESVIGQTYPHWELIIVDDGSRDRTNAIIQAYSRKDSRIRQITLRRNQGVAHARSLAIESARGEYIAFLDSDDTWHTEKLARQMGVFDTHEGVDLVFTAYEMIDAQGRRIKERSIKEKVTLPDLLKENNIIFSGVVCRKKSIEDIPFQPQWYHEDYVFLLDLLKNGKTFIGVNEPLLQYRVHQKGRSFNKLRSARYRWKIYRKYLNMNLLSSMYYFGMYAWNGIIKYT